MAIVPIKENGVAIQYQEANLGLRASMSRYFKINQQSPYKIIIQSIELSGGTAFTDVRGQPIESVRVLKVLYQMKINNEVSEIKEARQLAAIPAFFNESNRQYFQTSDELKRIYDDLARTLFNNFVLFVAESQSSQESQ